MVCECDNGMKTKCTRIRKPISDMSTAERETYFRVFRALYDNPDGWLKSHMDKHTDNIGNVHNDGLFLPWHRSYLLELENRLAQEDCTVTIPYWDWSRLATLSSSDVFGAGSHQLGMSSGCSRVGPFAYPGYVFTATTQNEVLGAGVRGCLERSVMPIPAPNRSQVESHVQTTPASLYQAFTGRVEDWHNRIHCDMGATAAMCSAASANDPLFFLHHAMVDNIWYRWQLESDAHKNSHSGHNRNLVMVGSSWTVAQTMDMDNLPGGVRVRYLFEGERVEDLVTPGVAIGR